MRWLIIGGDSTIGNSLSHAWSLQGRNFHSTTRNKFRVSKVRPYLDLGIDETSICSKDYDGAVLCIGESRVSYCEEHPRESSLINVQHTVELANALTKAGTYVLFLSSSRVFKGQTRSNPVGKIPDPTTEYGRQKVEAEKQILDLEGSGILRLPELEMAIPEIQRVGRRGYIMLESYRSNAELFNLQCWALTAQSFLDVDEWCWLYRRLGYSGDYEFIFFEDPEA